MSSKSVHLFLSFPFYIYVSYVNPDIHVNNLIQLKYIFISGQQLLPLAAAAVQFRLTVLITTRGLYISYLV